MPPKLRQRPGRANHISFTSPEAAEIDDDPVAKASSNNEDPPQAQARDQQEQSSASESDQAPAEPKIPRPIQKSITAESTVDENSRQNATQHTEISNTASGDHLAVAPTARPIDLGSAQMLVAQEISSLTQRNPLAVAQVVRSLHVLNADLVDRRYNTPLPMVHGCDLGMEINANDRSTFIPLSTRGHRRLSPTFDGSLDRSTGFIHADHPIYKFGGPVYTVRYQTGQLFDAMLCDTSICLICNRHLRDNFVPPNSDQRVTRGRPIVHMRDCRLREDGILDFWQAPCHPPTTEEEIPELRFATVRFTSPGIRGVREAMVCVPERCPVCSRCGI